MKPITIPVLKCERCGHEFVPRKTDRKKCSRCQSRWK